MPGSTHPATEIATTAYNTAVHVNKRREVDLTRNAARARAAAAAGTSMRPAIAAILISRRDDHAAWDEIMFFTPYW
jgi:hypothetical protein